MLVVLLLLPRLPLLLLPLLLPPLLLPLLLLLLLLLQATTRGRHQPAGHRVSLRR